MHGKKITCARGLLKWFLASMLSSEHNNDRTTSLTLNERTTSSTTIHKGLNWEYHLIFSWTNIWKFYVVSLSTIALQGNKDPVVLWRYIQYSSKVTSHSFALFLRVDGFTRSCKECRERQFILVLHSIL